jgi:hypothetical protein
LRRPEEIKLWSELVPKIVTQIQEDRREKSLERVNAVLNGQQAQNEQVAETKTVGRFTVKVVK